MNILTNNTKKGYKYKCKKLDCDSAEHKIVKNFYNKTTVTKKSCQKYHLPAGFNVYKIVENNPKTNLKEKRNNLMLFHGTNSIGVERILKEGFKNSTKGWFGKAVYMTDCSYTAHHYSNKKCKDGNDYLFVNEVFDSDSPEIIQHGRYHEYMFGAIDCDFKPKHPFEKHVYEGSQQLTEKDYKKDEQGRKYRNIEVKGISEEDEFVADESIVIPRFIIVTPQKLTNKDNILDLIDKPIEIKKNKSPSELNKISESLNLKSILTEGYSLKPDYKLLYNEFSNIESNLNNLELFGRDSETNNSYCHNFEHKPNKVEYFVLDSKLNKSECLNPESDLNKGELLNVYSKPNKGESLNLQSELIQGESLKNKSELNLVKLD